MGVIGAFLLKGLTNIKVIAVILIALMLAGVWFKFHHLESKLAKTQTALKQSEENNKILKSNNEIIADANRSNQAVIDQLAKDKRAATESVNKLSSAVAASNKSLEELQSKISGLTIPPTLLSPYIAEAIIGIQADRDKQAGVTPPAPKTEVPAPKVRPVPKEVK